LEKIVIGKPAVASDADGNQDYMSQGSEASCLKTAKDTLGWNGGAMFWEYPQSTTELIKEVRSQSWAV